jgi:hypothetical protein
MERKIALSILALTLLAIGIAIIMPGGRQVDTDPKLPWLLGVNADGSSTVFGLTLGKSRVADARKLLQEEGEVTLFMDPDGRFTIEVFFERVVLSGLKADMVMTADLTQQEMQPMYDRGTRISKLGSGERKVTLRPEDIDAAAAAPIRHLTYLPVADLDSGLIESRFGTPAQRIAEKSGATHWLYPEKGLDIAVDPERKEVFQYVAPKDFERLVVGGLREE